MPRKKPPASALAATLTKAVAGRKRKAAAAKAPRKNAALVGNPLIGADLWRDVAGGVGAYAATRIIGRIAYKVASKKSPAWAKHAGAIVPLLTAGGAWFAVGRSERWEQYRTPVLIGSAIAALQSLLQTYLPQWGWVLNDYHLDDMLPAQVAAQQQQAQAQANGAQAALPEPSADDEFDDILNADESMDDLYAGSFANNW